MPAKSLNAMAKKAGVSLKTAERYWKEAKASYTHAKTHVADKYAYIMGTVKKRLGLETIDLVLCGAPADMILETEEPNRVRLERLSDFDRIMATVVISELAKAERDGITTKMVMLDDRGDAAIRPSFIQDLDKGLSEGIKLEYLRKMFPNVNDDYLKAMAESVSRRPTVEGKGYARRTRRRKKPIGEK